MNSANLRVFCLAVRVFGTLIVTAIIGCQTCPFGQEIVIPSSDTTKPTIVMDFHLPNGNVVTVTPGSGISSVAVPGGGTVTVIVNSKDDEGVKSSEIWAADIKETTDPNTGLVTKVGPGLLGAPTMSNTDTKGPGQKGCTERVTQQNLEVHKTTNSSVSFEVSARGVNSEANKSVHRLSRFPHNDAKMQRGIDLRIRFPR